MHKLFTLAGCLLLGACSTQQPSIQAQTEATQTGPTATLGLKEIHAVPALPLSITPAAPQAAEPRQPIFDVDRSTAHYRVFELPLKKAERYRLSVNWRCRQACLDLSQPAPKPQVLLLDAYGAVIASQPSRTSFGIDRLTLGWAGEAREDGPYYLLVAAAPGDSGKTLVIDDIWINNSPLMALKFRSGH